MKKKVDINNANHPARQKAIKILEEIADYMGNETMFDCDEHKATWYDLEDLVTDIIVEK